MIDSSVPHSARIWNYWLGGKDNFEIDRIVGEQVREVFPDIISAARHSRAFLARAVRFLAGEAGIRQFLDVGTGLPTADNTHQVAQSVAPDARIVYVDNDPMVLTHARALLTSTPEGKTQYIPADMHDTAGIVAAARETLDFDKPIAVMFLGILGHVEDHAEARRIVGSLLAEVPSGSYLVMSDGTATSEATIEAHRQYNESGAVPYHLKTVEQIRDHFSELELLEPGVVQFTAWRPTEAGEPAYVDGYCAVGRKP